MHRHYPLPVIVGTDLTGLLISIALSRAQVSHVLIGDPPGGKLPRSGQILTPVGTTIFAKQFPELAHLAFPKRSRVVYAGDYFMKLDFEHPSMAAFRPVVKMLSGAEFSYPWNLDRVAADSALFGRAANDPFCSHLQGHISAVDYDAATDRIRSLTVEDGAPLPASHVYDASGCARLLGRQLDLPVRTLGATQMTVHAIYATDNEHLPQDLDDVAWYQQTASVVRLYDSLHGFDGFAVCVPLGRTVAIHVNRPVDASEHSADEMLEIAQKALSRYGIRFRDYFPTLVGQGSDEREQYVHSRAFGANWLLTGSAYSNTLVTTAASVDTSFAAFHTAVQFLKTPSEVGRLYQEYFGHFLTMQEVWRWATTHAPEALTSEELRHYIARYTWSNQTQFFQLAELQHFNNPLKLGMVLARNVIGNDLLSEVSAYYSSVERVDLPNVTIEEARQPDG